MLAGMEPLAGDYRGHRDMDGVTELWGVKGHAHDCMIGHCSLPRWGLEFGLLVGVEAGALSIPAGIAQRFGNLVVAGMQLFVAAASAALIRAGFQDQRRAQHGDQQQALGFHVRDKHHDCALSSGSSPGCALRFVEPRPVVLQ